MGSEMCIRDRAWVDLTSAEGQVKPNGQIVALAEAPTIDPRSTSHTLAPLVDLMDPGAQVGAATPDPLNASYVAVLAQVAGEDGVEIEQIDLFDFILKFKTMSDDRVKELEAVN